MGVVVSVGRLADLRVRDPEGAEMLANELQAVNRVLASNGLTLHTEPEFLPPIRDRVPLGSSMPYDWLIYLRRAVAYAMRPEERFRPLRGRKEPEEDPVYQDVLFSCESHIICHSDCEGFYVPID